ncbi:MAG: hypothetical protein EDX89_16670 [Acidobacteria bacterium]|nr:MAG: hypothetical protein EDX89_16670 [Acidobacteriota bacterium]
MQQLLEQSRPLDVEAPIFDLSGYQFVAPSAIASLAALVLKLARERRRPRVLCPDRSVHGYLCRAGFFAGIEGAAEIQPPVSEYDRLHSRIREGSNPLVLELTRLESGAALPNRLNQIVSVLRKRFRYLKHDAFDVATAISEICQNTFDHNHDACGFLTMQVYGRGAKRFLQVGVADYGDGITASLARNAKYRGLSDFEAIKRATELGSSEHDDPTRGTGLYHLLAIAYRQQGSVQIWSGSAKIRYRFDKRQGWGFAVPSLPGVHISLSLHARQTPP